MKVLQLIDTLELGGAERMAVLIANGLQEVGIPSFICATRASGPLERTIDASVTALLLSRKSTMDRKALLKLRDFVKENQITLIHAHGTSMYMAFMLKCIYPKVTMVWHDHFGLSDYLDQRRKLLPRIVARTIAGAITVNEELEQWSKNTLKIKKVLTLANFSAFDTSQQSVTDIRGAAGFRMVVLANLRPQKDHLTTIKIFQELIPVIPEATLHLVGKNFNDTHAQELEAYIRRNTLESKVFLYGSCPDVSAILSQMDLGVLLSKSEGMPLALLEYGLSGLPVVVSNVGMCGEVVGNEQYVLNDPLQEAKDVILTLYHDREKRISWGQLFKQRIQDRFGKGPYIEKLITFYHSL